MGHLTPLGTRQKDVLASQDGLTPVPTFYFTQLLAVALGLEPEVCRFELNDPAALALLKNRNLIAAATA